MRRSPVQATSARKRVVRKSARSRLRPFFEVLEQRQMLATSGLLPSAIVVGRTLSSYTVPGIGTNPLKITYSVYNETASPLSGVLLTTTLQGGVAFVGASVLPDRSGQQLAWSLGTLNPYDRASVELTVSRDAVSNPLSLDTGAAAFATLDARAVSDTAPAATLRSDAIAPELLASTPDANTTDPFIQEEAAALDYSSQAIFDFLHQDIGYNAYVGSLRGARGTLWSSAGNSVDVASLGVALMRASGIPAQYEQGSLSFNFAQQLILSMFPPSFQTVGYIPTGTQTANPLNDSTLYPDSTSSHTWFQFDTGDGQGMRDADPLIDAAIVGQSFATAQQTFAEVPDDQRHKTQIKLTAETYSQIGALFGFGNGLSTSTVLDQTFNDVDLVGKPLSIGSFVTTTFQGALFIGSTTTTYSPYIQVGDEAAENSSHDHTLRGTDFQEVITNFPLASQYLTGLFLQMEISGPGVPAETYDRALVDRIGFAARQGLVSTNVSVDPNGPPILTEADIVTVNVSPSRSNPRPPMNLYRELAAQERQLDEFAGTGNTLPPEAGALARSLLVNITRLQSSNFFITSDFDAGMGETRGEVIAYFDRPRLILVSTRTKPGSSSNTMDVAFSIDLRRDTMRVVAAPGQSSLGPLYFNLTRGVLENIIEHGVVSEHLASGEPPPLDTFSVVMAADAQHIPLRFITAANLADLSMLDMSAEAKARITMAANQGKVVLTPEQAVSLGGTRAVAWYEFDPRTGETVGVTEDGGHQAITEYAAAILWSFLRSVGISLAVDFLKKLICSSPSPDPNADNSQPPIDLCVKVFNYIDAGLQIWNIFAGIGAAVKNLVGLIEGTLANAEKTAFAGGLIGGGGGFFAGFPRLDPPVEALLVNMNDPETHRAERDDTVAAQLSSGPVTSQARSTSVAISGGLAASWSDTGTSSFQARSLLATTATIKDASGLTIGTGSVALSATELTAVTISGVAQYSIAGQGQFSFYGAAGTTLGVGGVWDTYSATVTGATSLSLTTAALSLNGMPLPGGTYTITTSSTTLGGGGATSSPSFAGSVVITSTNATVNLGQGTGSTVAGGAALDPKNGATLTGYNGTINISANSDGTDSVSLNGSAAQVLTVSATPADPTTDQNTPVVIQTNVATSLAGSYTLTARAPAGWSISLDDTGKLTATPAPGLQGGTVPIQIIARSTTNTDFVAQTIVNVTITPTQPGITFRVDPDPMFTVPYNGAQIPSAFEAIIHNIGPAADSFNLTFANVPAGFTLLNSGMSVKVPAGETAIVGLYLQPNSGQTLPAPGTQLSFGVTAKSASDAAITQTETETFTVPEIRALTLVANPATVNTTPGIAATAVLTITNGGNVDETSITFTTSTSTGLTLTGLAPLSLAIGQSTTQTATLTPESSIPLNSTLQATITASFGASSAALTHSVTLPVRLVVPGADAIANASVAAQELSDPGLADRFNDLSIALTDLVKSPTDPVAKSQALANLDSLISQLTTDPFLSGFTGGLTTARSEVSAATTAADVQAAVTKLGQALDNLASVITDLAEHQFTLSLSPDRQIVQPNAPLVFSIPITNNGTVATTYNLSVSGLPTGVSSQFNQTSVTLQPGQSLIAGNNAPTLTLIESGDTLVPASFMVIAAAVGAPEITRSVAGLLSLRNESIVVAGVVTNPPFANAGSQVNVSAKILGTVNEPTQVSASFVVSDSNGNTLFTSPPTPVSLTVTSGLLTVDLGSVDTTGFVDGVDTITVTLASGGSAQTTLLIGQPVSANLTTTPANVPTGSDTVTTTMSVTTQASFPAPLTLLGAASTPAPGTSVAIYQSAANTYAYESGTGGIDAFDVTDPSNPQLLKVFGQSDVVNGQFGFNIARIVSGKLVIATTTGLNASGFNLLVYDLTDPANPQFVSNTVINHRFLSDLLVNSTATAAFVPTNGVFFSGNRVSSTFGDFSAIDLSDPTHPVLGSTLFNNQGALDGGDMNQFGGTLINDQVAYSAGLAPGGNTVIGNHGNLLVVDITDATNISLITQLAISGTINIIDVAASGDRALVIGTAGIETGTIDFNVKGFANNLTLTLLDVSDPRNPLILGSTFVTNEQFPLNEAGAKTDVVALGNGQFAVSDTGANGLPALLVIDPSDPNNMIVGATQVPSGVHGITVAGDLLYASTSSGLSIYHIEPLLSSPVSITVNLPAGSVANIVLNSFNIAPSHTNTSDTGDSLVWDRSFASGNTNYTFTWQTKVSGVTAGQSIPVTSGASISFVDQGTPGSLTVPGTSVTGVSIISISPPSLTQQPGGSSTYNVRLVNPTDAAVTYNLSTSQSNSVGQTTVPFSVMVPANGSVDVPLSFTSFVSSQPGDDTITVTADYVFFTSDFRTQLGEFKGSATTSVTIAGAPVIVSDDVAHGVVAQLTPAEVIVGQGGDARYVVRLTNTGSETDSYSLEASGLPAGAFASFDDSFVEVPPGASNFRELTLIIHTFGVGPASYPFTVTATASSKSSITSVADGTLRVVSNGVSVSLSPASGNPGSSFNLTVRNTGTVADTFDLALGGPAALVSSLGVSQVTLEPGASQQVPITTTNVNFSLPGTLGLAAVATSVTETNVRSMADANLNIATALSMTAAFDQASKTLPAPGDATFQLLVQNTGNVEDSYQAVIMGTTGPITAFLVGLDGTPTQSVPIFRLPALATGALSLKISAPAGGLGSVTVQIRSLTDGSIASTSTATLNAATTTQEAAAPRVVRVERFGFHARPTTLVITFDRALEATSANTAKNYILRGPNGRIRLARVRYNPATLSVTLWPARLLPLKDTFHLVIRGTGQSFVRGATGTALDGHGTGQPGGDYVTRINGGALVIRRPSGLFAAKSHATRLLHQTDVPHGPRHLKSSGVAHH